MPPEHNYLLTSKIFFLFFFFLKKGFRSKNEFEVAKGDVFAKFYQLLKMKEMVNISALKTVSI